MCSFEEKIHKEIFQTQGRRHKLDLLKISLVTSLLGLGGINLKELLELYPMLYLPPLVALLFDHLLMREIHSIHRIGAYLRQNAPDPKEKEFEVFIKDKRNPYYRIACCGFTLLTILPSVFLLVSKQKLEILGIIWFSIVALISIIFHISSFRSISELDEM